ncbi:MAG: LicD family protein [Clostridiales bacterium]|nr:LicD family protein [Clostridiales bacterium]
MTNDYGNLELHEVLLSAMKDIDKICRENNLRYFLHAGTLLGAMNHKGFIPWDDDVDISMFREDYEKFLSIVHEQMGDRYFVQTYKTDPEYPNNRAVLRVLGTEVIHFHEDDTSSRKEIAVDIVPLDSVPDLRIVQRFQQGLVWVLDAAVQIKQGSIIPRSVFTKCIGLLAKVDRVRLGRWIDNVTCICKSKKTKLVGLLSYTGKNPYTGVSGYYNDLLKREWYDSPEYVPFEDTQFMTIGEPEADLLHRYGPHWAEPYPEEKRVTKHDVKSYRIEPWVLDRVRQ